MRAEEPSSRFPLGAARAQLHENYIVAQTENGLVIVDQHAAHERLVFEAMRKALHSRRLSSQVLLIPEIIDLSEEDCDRLMAFAEELGELGLAIERFGPGAVAVRLDAGLRLVGRAHSPASWSARAALMRPPSSAPTALSCSAARPICPFTMRRLRF